MRSTASNQACDEAWRSDYAHLDEQLRRRGLDPDAVVEQVAAFEVAVPSWALGTGGTRFGRFPGRGEPRDVFEKMQDVSVVRRLTGSASRISLHIPWERTRRSERSARAGRGARGGIRCGKLEHLSGSGRTNVQLQVRIVSAHRSLGAQTGGGAQSARG